MRIDPTVRSGSACRGDPGALFHAQTGPSLMMYMRPDEDFPTRFLRFTTAPAARLVV